MFKKITIIGTVLVLSVLVVGIFLWHLDAPQQSSVRLRNQLLLKELLIAIDSYRDAYNTIPKTLEHFETAGIISDTSRFDQFKYVAGSKGILAFQEGQLRKVKKGEAWGGSGQVANRDIPAARLILFADRSIEFIDASDFRRKYGDLLRGTEAGQALTKKQNVVLAKLVPGINWRQWYRETSGYSPDPKHFGASITLPVGNDLYIGLGTGLPSLGDGALIARFDGKSLEPIGSLAEEGVHEMVWDHHTGTLHIAGTDPSWPDDWSAGNHYSYKTGQESNIIKHRDPINGLVNVIHTWGLWMSDDHILYAAVNSQDGSFTRDRNILRRIFNRINFIFNESYYSTDYGVTRKGQIFKSTDSGASWHHVGDLGYFRAYDIIGFNDKLYAIYTDMPGSPSKLAVSEDRGKKWRDVSPHYIQQVHLTQFQDKLLAVSLSGKSIYAVGSEDTITEYHLPKGFRVASDFVEVYFNVVAAGNDYLYAITTAGDGTNCILRTADLLSWEQIVCTDQKLISISYWRAQNSLVVSSEGIHAELWKIDIDRLRLVTRSMPDSRRNTWK